MLRQKLSTKADLPEIPDYRFPRPETSFLGGPDGQQFHAPFRLGTAVDEPAVPVDLRQGVGASAGCPGEKWREGLVEIRAVRPECLDPLLAQKVPLESEDHPVATRPDPEEIVEVVGLLEVDR